MNALLRDGEGDKEEIRITEARLNETLGVLNETMAALNFTSQLSGLSKALKAIHAIGSAIDKFNRAKNSDGSYNVNLLVSGVFDIVNEIAEYLPPPISTITGTMSKLFNLFTNGGTPSQDQILKDLFASQSKMIKEEFEKQREAFEAMLDASELQTIETKAMGVLDALESRDDFISAYDGLETCLSDDVAAEITERVNYFTDQFEIYTISHVFDKKCLNLAKKSELSKDEPKQFRACATLLYTYLTIEKKKRHILSRMIALLSNSKSHYQVSDGYLEVLYKDRIKMSAWLNDTFLIESSQDVFCGMFFNDMAQWNYELEDSKPRSMTLQLMTLFSMDDNISQINCFDKAIRGKFHIEEFK